ncbi:hypothetical protein [Singulisphaera acidiphila]|uniref:Uncharacterized protein n=1 Tax=Singulisphaera acidiphila (strain ATCC BAA-1392 / DSM 18658 / VKM B-2454 / MOB10) TaxID=886293 RepID=L0DFC0_SINAD|nr:hypothetical protein [Singulisphaera acidiphila]AGA28079.1 hypothetical protein Sinac_3847 [Singulisphaera acidiphila DSM 18658]
MASPRRQQSTLAQIMTVNVAVAILLGAYRLGPAGLAPYCLALLWVAIGLLIVLLIMVTLDAILGIPCPSCQRRSLRRLALPLNLVSYYQCTACKTRCKRLLPLAHWRDASSPKDAAKYRRKSPTGKWLGYVFPGPQTDDSTCTGTLLRSKRLRTPTPGAEEEPSAL